MTLRRVLFIASIVLFVITCVMAFINIYQNVINANLVKINLFFLYTSFLVLSNFLFSTTFLHKKSSLIILTIVDILLLTFAFLTIYDVINFIAYWHILIGVTLFYLMIIQLNLIGWSHNEHTLFQKILFLLMLISNLFLVSLFLFKINLYIFQPLFVAATITALVSLLLGYFIQNKNKKRFNNLN